MNYEQIVTLIGSLGFPIVVCFILFWFINKTIEEVKDTVDNNTRMVEKLLDKINKEGKE